MASTRFAAIAALGVLLAATAAAAAGPLVLEDVEVRELEARANGVRYRLWIRVPEGERAEGERLRVVYLLDADYSFLLARNITDHLTERGDLEPLILVGVGYVGQDDAVSYRLNRSRDYTPWHVPTGGYGVRFQRASGGAPRFADFLENELFPWIEAEYPAAADRTLVGHSYGGLFASWMLLQRPRAFRRYVIASPSLWYDDANLLAAPVPFTPPGEDAPVSPAGRAYFGVGSREINGARDMPAQMIAFVERLRAAKLESLALSSRVWEDETHNSVFPLVLSSGLRFVHEGR